MIKTEPDAVYRKANGFSNSELSDYRKSFANWLWNKEHKTEPTLPMRLGTLIHTRILEPEKFNAVVKPDGMKFSTTEGKNWKKQNEGKEILTQDEYQMILGIEQSLKDNPITNKLMYESSGLNEVSIYWTDPETDVEGKGRIDRRLNDDVVLPNGNKVGIVDLKTVDSIDRFIGNMKHRKGDRQAGWYSWGNMYSSEETTPRGFCWVVVERKPPYQCAVFDISQTDISSAYELNLRDAKRLMKDIQKSKNGELVVSYPDVYTIYF